MDRDPNTQYNADDFLLEIEHLNTQINNREKQMQSDTFKVRFMRVVPLSKSQIDPRKSLLRFHI
jgi:hypothetical protein